MARKIAAGNWKMNFTLQQAETFINDFNKESWPADVEVMFAVPFPYLMALKAIARPGITIAAQNCSDHEEGAYTGEVSAAMLASAGISHVILGHSERRMYYQDSTTVLKDKVDLALAHELVPVFCCGEPLEVRNEGKHFDLVRSQLQESLFHLTGEALGKIVIAYEPVWAIGTGVTASPEQAQEMHAYIREVFAEAYGVSIAQQLPILYGGSVKASNAQSLFSQADVNGGLVGGASLITSEFLQITNSF
ncbi:MAG: triose-phosphate isomerase [Lewinellaceae bacterium]|nr:triose-phosphate isomerase [Saprospiraceae bacterium]MCB9269442.1 triose-phosphate isomerase [Lewinellaceae bacterium]HPQ98508.1 triose-phosphate isomerase [Saprospiraceae bacterium]